MIPQGNKARFAGILAAVAAVLALVALPGLASAHHGRESMAPAGTIESFDQETGMLTIALTEGGSVSGLVTPRTHVHCDNGRHNGRRMGRRGLRHRLRHRRRHSRASASRDHSGESADNRDSAGEEEPADDNGEGTESEEDSHEGSDDSSERSGTAGSHSEGSGQSAEHSARCTTEGLTEGATVKYADLVLVDGRAIFKMVALPAVQLPAVQNQGEGEGEAES